MSVNFIEHKGHVFLCLSSIFFRSLSEYGYMHDALKKQML